jgi:hypothetical protein
MTFRITGTGFEDLPVNNLSASGTVSLPSTTSIGNVADTEIAFVDGVTSSLQTQLNAKASIPGAWITYTPVLTQTVTVNTSTTTGRYVRIGTLVVVRVRLIASSSGTAGGIISVTLPFAADPTYSTFGISGSGIIFKASSNTQHAVVVHGSDTTAKFLSDISGGGNFGQQSSFQLVSSDYVSFTAMYEVAP